jgi:hypothetical protein
MKSLDYFVRNTLAAETRGRGGTLSKMHPNDFHLQNIPFADYFTRAHHDLFGFPLAIYTVASFSLP